MAPSEIVSMCTGRRHRRWRLLRVSARVVLAEVDALVAMLEQELAAILVVAVDHVDGRAAEVGELEEQLAA